MTEYITKEQAKNPFYFLDKEVPKYEMDYPEWCDVIDELQPADVAPVVHAEWMKFYDLVLTCSHCSGMMPAGLSMFQFCPHCGARMDGGESDDKR